MRHGVLYSRLKRSVLAHLRGRRGEGNDDVHMPHGHVTVLWLPSDLLQAPTWFENALDIIISGLRSNTGLVYREVVIVLSRTVDEHIRHLREVLRQMEKVGVSLKPFNCRLFQEELEYLGHGIHRGQLLVKQKNIKIHAQELATRKPAELMTYQGMRNVC